VASKTANAWVVPPDLLPLDNEIVPRVVPPEVKVMSPVGGEPVPEAATVAVSSNDCAVCCEVRTVLVPTFVIVKLIGVKSTLELKLLSP